MHYKNYDHLLCENFSIDDITRILQNLVPNRAHGHVKIGIFMLQLCGNSICKPMEYILKQYMQSGSFPSEWEKIPIQVKDAK